MALKLFHRLLMLQIPKRVILLRIQLTIKNLHFSLNARHYWLVSALKFSYVMYRFVDVQTSRCVLMTLHLNKTQNHREQHNYS